MGEETGIGRVVQMQSHEFERKFLYEIKKRFGIIGESNLIDEAVTKLIQTAPTDLTVLITGETGTGKEVFANAIHGLSKRKKMPLVSVNCGAIPETLLESELFGHEKGAFTGAIEQRIGFFETAHNGTIFLDEIGEMPIGTQVKLLRVLESGQFSRIGSSSVKQVDVRIIAATNRELENFIEQGKFRRDLFFRLNSVHIKLPALREHTQDIPELAEYFAERTCNKLNVNFEGISKEAMNILKSLPWTGNIRELKNLVDTICTLEKGALVTPEILRKYIPPALPAHAVRNMDSDKSLVSVFKDELGSNELLLIFKTLLDIKSDISEVKRNIFELMFSFDKLNDSVDNMQIQTADEIRTQDELLQNIDTLRLDDMEKKMIMLALKKNNGNRRLAAESLGISERTLYRKLTDYGIEI
ncbi:MAG: sigma-54 dependent transcriptional regulator [Candidatus Kapaibacterium sp.]